MDWSAFSRGAALCASLIVTIGAQNAFVLRQAIMRSHIGKILIVCMLSDVLLIGAGVGGASALMNRYPAFVRAMLYVGLTYLVWFGLNALWRAFRPANGGLTTASSPEAPAPSARAALPTILMTLALTWLNPHVYLDTFLLIGTAGARESETGRVAFAVGAMCASALWFVLLGYGARALAPLFRRAVAWRILDGAIGGMVLLIAATQLP